MRTVVILIASALPVLVMALTPRRWLGPALALTAVFPFWGSAASLGFEAMVQRQSVDGQEALYGMMLIGSMSLGPWLLICIIGVAVGFPIRWVLQRLARPAVYLKQRSRFQGLDAGEADKAAEIVRRFVSDTGRPPE